MSIISPVILLLFLGSPSHIAGFVMAVIINPIQRVLRARLSAYVRNKLSNGSEPKFNTSASVISVSGLLWIVTSLFGRIVASEFWRDFSLSAFTVGDRVLAFCFFLKASARPNVSGCKVACAGNRLGPTGAFTCPTVLTTRSLVKKTDYGQPVETLAGQISEIVGLQAFARCHYA